MGSRIPDSNEGPTPELIDIFLFAVNMQIPPSSVGLKWRISGKSFCQEKVKPLRVKIKSKPPPPPLVFFVVDANLGSFDFRSQYYKTFRIRR